MAYDATRYQLTHLLQDAWYKLGQIKRWKATGGSNTTVVNTTWAGVEEQIFEDDDPALIYGTMVVIEDTGGLAPEGELAMITDYDSSTSTITFDQISSAISANDRIGIVSPLFPLEDMISLANIALSKLGEIDVPEYVTVQNGTTVYSLPAGVQTIPSMVRHLSATANVRPRIVSEWTVMPDSPESALSISIPKFYDVGGQFEIFYRSTHPTLTDFDSTILASISPEVAVSALVAEAYQWYNNQLGGSNQYFLQRENKALQDLEAALVKHPIRKLPGQIQGFVHWGQEGRYVPLTSDLRE
jgi:hypothetical protein